MEIFKSNGLRFYPVDTDEITPKPVNFQDYPFYLQSVAGVHQPEGEKGYQAVDFSDVSYIQVWSDGIPDLQVFDKNDVLLANLGFTEIGEMDSIKVYQVEINWVNIPNTGDGIYLIVDDGTDYYRSEPIYEPLEGIIKLTYSNNNDSFDYGLYSFCGSMVAYFKARLHDFEIPVDRIVWEDNLGQNRTLRQSKRNLKKFETCKLPYYQQEQLVTIFSHDKLAISIKRGGFSVSDQYEVFENNSLKISKPEPLYNAFDSNIVLALKDSFVRRVPNEKNKACELNVTINVAGIGLVRMTNDTTGEVYTGAGSFEVAKGDTVSVRFGIDDLDIFTGNHQYTSESLKGWSLPSRIGGVLLNGFNVIYSAIEVFKALTDIVGEIVINNIQASQTVDIEFGVLQIRQEYDFSNPLSYVDNGQGLATIIRDLRGYTPDLVQNIVSKMAVINPSNGSLSSDKTAFYPTVSLPTLEFGRAGSNGTSIFAIFKNNSASGLVNEFCAMNYQSTAVRVSLNRAYLENTGNLVYSGFGYPEVLGGSYLGSPYFGLSRVNFVNDKMVISTVNSLHYNRVLHDTVIGQVVYEPEHDNTTRLFDKIVGEHFTFFSDGSDISNSHRYRGEIFYLVQTYSMTFEEQESFQSHLKIQEL